MSIGDRIIDLRKQKGLSQGQVAEMIGVSRQAVSKWESGQNSPDTVKLIKLADVLDTDVEYLATGRNVPKTEQPIVVNMVKKVDKVIEVEKIVEKPVIKRIIRVKYRRNPVEYWTIGIICFLIGLAIGILL